MNLSDGIALVAGASGDIGRAIAFGLLEADAEVFMLGRSMTRLAEPPLPQRFREKCHFVVADLTDNDAIARVGAEIASRKRLDASTVTSLMPRFALNVRSTCSRSCKRRSPVSTKTHVS